MSDVKLKFTPNGVLQTFIGLLEIFFFVSRKRWRDDKWGEGVRVAASGAHNPQKEPI